MSITVNAPVAGLPAGPATEATVRAQLNLAAGDTLDDPAIEQAINAANQSAVQFPFVWKWIQTVDVEAPNPEWRSDLVLGVTMLAARLYRRRNSTEGVAVFADQGAVYVQRNDPDIALLLRLGAQRMPAVG